MAATLHVAIEHLNVTRVTEELIFKLLKFK